MWPFKKKKGMVAFKERTGKQDAPKKDSILTSIKAKFASIKQEVRKVLKPTQEEKREKFFNKMVKATAEFRDISNPFHPEDAERIQGLSDYIMNNAQGFVADANMDNATEQLKAKEVVKMANIVKDEYPRSMDNYEYISSRLNFQANTIAMQVSRVIRVLELAADVSPAPASNPVPEHEQTAQTHSKVAKAMRNAFSHVHTHITRAIKNMGSRGRGNGQSR